MAKTEGKKYKKQNKKTVKNRNNFRKINNHSNRQNSIIVKNFIGMLSTVKLYHWKTRSYAEHKATDELYGILNENIDKFVETLLGKIESRIRLMDKKTYLIGLDDTEDCKTMMYEYRDFLIGLTRIMSPTRDSDLLNIRDEILGNINQFLYLMTFDK